MALGYMEVLLNILWNIWYMCCGRSQTPGEWASRSKSKGRPHSKRFSFTGQGHEDESEEFLLKSDVETGHIALDDPEPYSTSLTCPYSPGTLRFRLAYSEAKECLFVTIVDAWDLPAMDSNGKADPYVSVCLKPGSKRFTTSIKHKCRNPTFNENVDFPLKMSAIADKDLVIKVMDSDYPLQDDLIGIIRIPLAQIDLKLSPQLYTCLVVSQTEKDGIVTLSSDDAALMNLRISEQTNHIYDLEVKLQSFEEKFQRLNQDHHELKIQNFELEMEPFKHEFDSDGTSSSAEDEVDVSTKRVSPLAFLSTINLKIDVIQATNLRSVNLYGDHSDPFVKIKVFNVKPGTGKKTDKWKFESKPVWKNVNPSFNVSYVIPDRVVKDDLLFMSAEVLIIDKSHFRSDNPLGKVRLGPNLTTDSHHWEQMINNPGKTITMTHALQDI
eukprot:maker-scaffold589_size129586-snap-gene-0.41 protein:Tk07350 transcript:maker-scaffold589_size129586-snap-gene-0.41-mRNA-1 annotation:"cre-snt-3 protein"